MIQLTYETLGVDWYLIRIAWLFSALQIGQFRIIKLHTFLWGSEKREKDQPRHQHLLVFLKNEKTQGTRLKKKWH